MSGVSEEAMRLLLDHSWPGNVRELENSIEHAVVLAKTNKIQTGDLPISLQGGQETGIRKPAAGATLTMIESEEQLIQDALAACAWNKSAAAAQLGISRSTLYEKLKKYDIKKPTLH